MYFNGFPVIVSDYLCKEWRTIKRHRSKRINKKWNKKYGVIKICIKAGDAMVVDDMYGNGKTIFVCPKTYKIIKKEKING